MVSCVDGKWMFRVVCPDAHRVYLVGDFNNWSRTAVAMDPVGRGVWVTALALSPGEYRFRYFADGRWLNDYAAFGLAPNDMGDWDSVLWVPDPAEDRPEPVAEAPPGPSRTVRSRQRTHRVH